jgi:hypothetical protein
MTCALKSRDWAGAVVEDTCRCSATSRRWRIGIKRYPPHLFHACQSEMHLRLFDPAADENKEVNGKITIQWK